MDQRRASVDWTRGYEKAIFQLLRKFLRDHERSRYPRNLAYISMKTRTTESLTAALLIEQV